MSALRALTLLTLGLWPATVFAGPPTLPSLPGGDMRAVPQEEVEPAEPVAPRTPTQPVTRTATPSQPPSTPLQRPATMAAPQPNVPGPTSSPAPPSTTIASPPPAEIGPQPPPVRGPSIAPEAGPRTPEPDPALDATPSPDAALAEDAQSPTAPFAHRGIVADLRIGTLGCLGGMCSDKRHSVSPGLRVGGFLGGNIRGWVELGFGGGWGTMKPGVAPGTNALVLYGLDPGVLQQALLAQAAGVLNVDLAGLAVSDAQMRAVQAGPRMRIHLVPRGRVGAFIGSGVGYNLLRTRYETGVGTVGLDFHGIEVPVEANLSVYVLENLAVGVQFDYMWTWYGLAVLDHPQQRAAMPMSVLQAAAQQQSVDLRGELPQLWTLGLAIRGRL